MTRESSATPRSRKPLLVEVPEELREWLQGFARLCPYFGSTEEAVAIWLIRSSIMDKVTQEYLKKAKEMTDLLKARK
jgi:hypothetical protein